MYEQDLKVLCPLLSDLFDQAVGVLEDTRVWQGVGRPEEEIIEQLGELFEAASVLQDQQLRLIGIEMYAIEKLRDTANPVDVIKTFATAVTGLSLAKSSQYKFDLAFHVLQDFQNSLIGDNSLKPS